MSGPSLWPEPDVLVCPLCGEQTTHIDEVVFGYRREDEISNLATFNAVDGELTRHGVDTRGYSSRRHWVGLVIDCEICPGAMVVFAQHKGGTEVSVVPRLPAVNAERLESPT